MSHKYDDFIEFASQRELDYIEAIREHGSLRKAAKILGVGHTAIANALSRLKSRAATKIPHDASKPLPEGYMHKGVSQLVDKDGNTRLTWYKTTRDHAAMQAMQDAALAAFAEQMPRVTIPEFRVHDVSSEIVPVIQVGDMHIGGRSWKKETGIDTDTELAVRDHKAALSILLSEITYVDSLVLNFLGDMTESENFEGITARSGNILDVDTRLSYVLGNLYRLVRWSIDACLQKAKNVTVVFLQGNHDRSVALNLAQAFKIAYENTGRVNVVDNSGPFVPLQIGRTFAVCHHGDTAKGARLADVALTTFATRFAEAKYRCCWLGHTHSSSVSFERGGVRVEHFGVLAAPNHYAQSHGFKSERSITMLLIHREYGETHRRLLRMDEIGTTSPEEMHDHTVIV